jgi:hypothetical protein
MRGERQESQWATCSGTVGLDCNFQAEEQTVEVNLGGVDFDEMTDLESSSRVTRQPGWRLTCQAMVSLLSVEPAHAAKPKLESDH